MEGDGGVVSIVVVPGTGGLMGPNGPAASSQQERIVVGW